MFHKSSLKLECPSLHPEYARNPAWSRQKEVSHPGRRRHNPFPHQKLQRDEVSARLHHSSFSALHKHAERSKMLEPLMTNLFPFFFFSVCSDSERLEKEGHCSPHTNSNSGNPHSVSTVYRLFPFLFDSSVSARLDVLYFTRHERFFKPAVKW